MQIGALIAINLVIGFTIPGIDNAAHIGGLLAGAWLGFVLVPRGPTLGSFWSRPADRAAAGGQGVAPPGTGGRDPATVVRLTGVLALIGVVVIGVAMGPTPLG
jgi:hypothetical protein